MPYQILTCPDCQGLGCPTCQNTGKVRVDSNKLGQLKTLLNQSKQPDPISTPQPDLNYQSTPQQPALRRNTNLAGIIAFSILSIFAGSAAASWYFLKSLKLFFIGLFSLLTLIGTRIALNQPFFQLQEPDDFLKAVKNHVA